MPGLDLDRPFIPVRLAVLTVSSTRTVDDDRSGAYLNDVLTEAGHTVVHREIVVDNREEITRRLQGWIEDPSIDVVIATGGTGLTGSDVTPEAFEALYDKAIPGFGEVFRHLSYGVIGASTLQSRTTAGVASGTYLFALPGSPSACRDAWEGILKHQLDNRFRPCNLVELMPRLRESQAT